MNTRFNPTTNGTGHLGHAYIAILNYHAAKSSGGEFIVRFDDDQEWWVERLGRAKMAEYAEAWNEDLEWLGIVPNRYTSEAEERGSNEALMAAFPLLANKPELVKKAREVFELLKGEFPTIWDDRGNIGKRYYSQDEIGTPFCLTIDFDTLQDNTVTLRDRDTMKQERVKTSDLKNILQEKLKQ